MNKTHLAFFSLFFVLFAACDKPQEKQPTNSLLKDYVKKPLNAAGESKALTEEREANIQKQFEEVGQ